MEAWKLTFHKQQNPNWLHLQVHHKCAPKPHLQTPENQIYQKWNHQDSSARVFSAPAEVAIAFQTQPGNSD